MNNIFDKYLTPPKKERLPEAISNQIKKLILEEKIKIGNKLPTERELSDMLKVSRVVIKQALITLEQSGFVTIKRGPKGGAFVINRPYKPFSDHIKDLFIEGNLSMRHFFEARQAVEGYNIKLAVDKVSKDDIVALNAINRKIIDDIEEPLSRFAKNNWEFHIKLADISENPLLKTMIQSLLDHFYLFWEKSHIELDRTTIREDIKDGFNRHKRIIDALKKKDRNKCVKYISEDTGYNRRLVDFAINKNVYK